MYRYVNKKLPSSFDNLFNRSGNFDRSLAFELPKVNKAELKTLPAFSMIKVWNELPLYLRRKNSLKVFKTLYSKKLLECYNANCIKQNCYSCR